MPAKRKGELVLGQYFKWVVDTRKGVYRADGRSNSPNVGRHSLGVRDRKHWKRAARHTRTTLTGRAC